jgi:hypothetical protein
MRGKEKKGRENEKGERKKGERGDGENPFPPFPLTFPLPLPHYFVNENFSGNTTQYKRKLKSLSIT